MKIIKYPDNTSYVEIQQFDKEFTFRINSYEDLWHLRQITDVYEHNGIKPTITIPWLIDGQADDRFDENQSSGLKLVCSFLNGMYANFKIFHPHNSSLVKGLMNVEIIDNSAYLTNVLIKLYPNDNLILMSTDGGSYKWINKIADKIGFKNEVYGASKMRKYENGKSLLTQVIDKQDFGGKDIILVDDISIYGGTFKGLSKMLKERNCGKLYLAVSHMTVQNLGNDPVTNYFDKVFTTNSKYDEYFTSNNTKPDNLTIIKMF